MYYICDVEQLNAHALKARGQEKIVNILWCGHATCYILIAV